jgi:hypothetical protein
MPVSDIANISPILKEVDRLSPRSICDLGIGYGKYGVLLRELLDIGKGNLKPEEWHTVIDGIEGFAKYRSPLWGAYNNVTIANFLDIADRIVNYDLVLMIDSLEHVVKGSAYEVLNRLLAQNKHVIVSVPLGDCPQGAVHGNVLETHLSSWSGLKDFVQYSPRILHQGVCLVVSLCGTRGATIHAAD